MSVLDAFVTAVPKVELHLHLVGSATPATVAGLARRHPDRGVPTSATAVAELFRFRDLRHFIEVYEVVNGLVTSAEDIAAVVEGAGDALADQNVRYAEMTVTPHMHVQAGVPYAAVVEGLAEGRRRAAARGVELAWVYDVPGDHGTPAVDATVRWALDDPPDGLVALGLAGVETAANRAEFAPAFAAARAAGLPNVPHAGEGDGPASVWAALRHLEPARIGHGVRAIEDPELVAHLAATGIPLEVCPSSNVCINLYDRLEDHPVAELMRAGVVVTVNSDDPPMFNTTLVEEYRRVAAAFSLGLDDVAELVLAAVDASFLPREAKLALRDEVGATHARFR